MLSHKREQMSQTRPLEDRPNAGASRSIALALILSAIAAALYGHTLTGYFLGDDFANVTASIHLTPANWPALFVTDVSGSVWQYSLRMLRPIATIAMDVQVALFGGDALGYRVTGLVLHIFNTWLVFVIARRLLSRQLAAFGAALLFCVHPAHVEPVVWIAGQSDLLPAVFFLAAVLAFLQFRQGAKLLALVALAALSVSAFFTKENAVVLPLLLAAYDLLHRRRAGTACSRDDWRRLFAPYGALLIALAAYFICRRIALGADLGGPSLAQSVITILQTIPARYGDYVAHLLWPLDLSRATKWPVAAKLHLLLPFALLFIAPPVLIARRATGRAAIRVLLFAGPIWFVVTTVPFLLSYSSARHLYIPSAGFCIFAAGCLQLIGAGRRTAYNAVLLGAVAAVWAYGLRQESAKWRQAGAITREFHRQVTRLSHKPAGTALIVSLPAYHGDIATLAWSIPFVFEPPLFSPSLQDRLIVLPYPPTYYAPHLWPRHPAISALSRFSDTAEVFLMTYDSERRRLQTRRIEPARLRSGIAQLEQELAAKPAPPYEPLWWKFAVALED